jgi:hypothetical protein
LFVSALSIDKDRGDTAVDANDLRRTVQGCLNEGAFTLMYLWIMFRANGGGAPRTSLEAFLHGLQALSDNDVSVLGSVVEELQDPYRPQPGLRGLPRRT